MASAMKTTLELPDPLMRQIKVRAANSNRTIKDVVAELITRGLKVTPAVPESSRMDLTQYIGKRPRYESIDEVNAWMDELRQNRYVED